MAARVRMAVTGINAVVVEKPDHLNIARNQKRRQQMDDMKGKCPVMHGGNTAMSEMMEEAQALGANAVVGVDIDYETIRDGMLMVTAAGTAVIVE